MGEEEFVNSAQVLSPRVALPSGVRSACSGSGSRSGTVGIDIHPYGCERALQYEISQLRLYPCEAVLDVPCCQEDLPPELHPWHRWAGLLVDEYWSCYREEACKVYENKGCERPAFCE